MNSPTLLKELLQGAQLISLLPHVDSRGMFTEIFRASWETGVNPPQWNAVVSQSNVLRGVHAHWRHGDYLVVLQGQMVIGLHDLRCSSSTYRASTLVTLTGSIPQVLVIPPGVAHGFFFPESSLHIYAVSHYWNAEDELGCRWDDPELKIPWPCETPILSQRDASLGSFAALNRLLNQKLASKHS